MTMAANGTIIEDVSGTVALLADHRTRGQLLAMGVLFVSAAVLSACGSFLIIYRVFITKKIACYERLLCGFACFDILFSFLSVVNVLFFWPTDKPSLLCTIHGFVLVLTFGSPFYSTALSYYYLLVIVYDVKQEKLEKFYEPIFHLCSLSIPLIYALSGLFLQAYSPDALLGTCTHVDAYPPTCTGNECTRGDPRKIKINASVGLFLYSLVMGSLVANNLRIYCKVKRQEDRMGRYGLSAATDKAPARRLSGYLANSAAGFVVSKDDSFGDHHDSETPRARRHSRRPSISTTLLAGTAAAGGGSKSARVAAQSFCYVGAFFVAFGPALVLTLLEMMNQDLLEERWYPIQLLNAILYPSQGLFNALVFVRPKYLMWRHSSSELSRLYCLRKALFSLEKPRFPSLLRNRGSVVLDHDSEQPSYKIGGMHYDDAPVPAEEDRAVAVEDGEDEQPIKFIEKGYQSPD